MSDNKVQLMGVIESEFLEEIDELIEGCKELAVDELIVNDLYKALLECNGDDIAFLKRLIEKEDLKNKKEFLLALKVMIGNNVFSFNRFYFDNLYTSESFAKNHPFEYGVIIFDNEKSTFDFVICLLKTVFKFNENESKLLTSFIHIKGSVVIKVSSKEELNIYLTEIYSCVKGASDPLDFRPIFSDSVILNSSYKSDPNIDGKIFLNRLNRKIEEVFAPIALVILYIILDGLLKYLGYKYSLILSMVLVFIFSFYGAAVYYHGYKHMAISMIMSAIAILLYSLHEHINLDIFISKMNDISFGTFFQEKDVIIIYSSSFEYATLFLLGMLKVLLPIILLYLLYEIYSFTKEDKYIVVRSLLYFIVQLSLFFLSTFVLLFPLTYFVLDAFNNQYYHIDFWLNDISNGLFLIRLVSAIVFLRYVLHTFLVYSKKVDSNSGLNKLSQDMFISAILTSVVLSSYSGSYSSFIFIPSIIIVFYFIYEYLFFDRAKYNFSIVLIINIVLFFSTAFLYFSQEAALLSYTFLLIPLLYGFIGFILGRA